MLLNFYQLHDKIYNICQTVGRVPVFNFKESRRIIICVDVFIRTVKQGGVSCLMKVNDNVGFFGGVGGGIVQERPSLQTYWGLFKDPHNDSRCANRCGILFVLNGGGCSMETPDGA